VHHAGRKFAKHGRPVERVRRLIRREALSERTRVAEGPLTDPPLLCIAASQSQVSSSPHAWPKSDQGVRVHLRTVLTHS